METNLKEVKKDLEVTKIEMLKIFDLVKIEMEKNLKQNSRKSNQYRTQL